MKITYLLPIVADKIKYRSLITDSHEKKIRYFNYLQLQTVFIKIIAKYIVILYCGPQKNK